MLRYLGLIWHQNNTQSVRRAQLLRPYLFSKPAEWSVVYDGPGMTVICAGLQYGSRKIYKLADQMGVVLGQLFSAGGGARSIDSTKPLGITESEKAVRSGGAHLVRNYWGSYVAFLYDSPSQSYYIFNDPTKMTPCYHLNSPEVNIFFSNVEDCAQLLPLDFTISRQFLLHWLMDHSQATRETGLQGLEELYVGEGVHIKNGVAERLVIWEPIEISRSPSILTPSEACETLRHTTQSTIDAWASCYRHVALRLSGGLDSSIVAGCLAQAPSEPQVTHLNFYCDITLDQEPPSLPGYDVEFVDRVKSLLGSGDERHFARLVSSRWNVPLIEEPIPTHRSLSDMWTVPLKARPFPSVLGNWGDDLQRNLAEQNGVDAYFSGQAGDSLFYASRAPSCAVDYAALHGLRSTLWPHILNACNISDLSIWTVAKRVLKYGVLGRPVPRDTNFLTTPWLVPTKFLSELKPDTFDSPLTGAALSSDLPPGKKTHVRGLEMLPYYHSGPHSETRADFVHPLNSQPMWEFMLRLPTYLLQYGGLPRGLARVAFKDRIPNEILRRMNKGSGTPLLQRQIRENRAIVQNYLENGRLVCDGLLDAEKLRACLQAADPSFVVDSGHVQQCLAAEIWIRQWEQTSAAGKSQLPTSSVGM